MKLKKNYNEIMGLDIKNTFRLKDLFRTKILDVP